MARTKSTKGFCVEEDCNRPEYTDGLCSMHYQRQRKYGRLHLIVQRLPAFCEAPGCMAKPRARHSGRALCNRHGLRWHKYGSLDLPPKEGRKQIPQCSVDGCANLARSGVNRYCEMHYYRIRRNGNLKGRTPAPPRLNDDGYMVRCCKGHPVAAKGGQLYVHREVLFAHIGSGAHECHWCKREIEWGLTGRRKLVVDHLDGNKANNALSNLVPSCHQCNANRGLFQSWVAKHRDDPFLWTLYQQAKAA